MAERMSIADYKATVGKSNANARKGNKRSRDKEKLGQYLLYGGREWETEYRFDRTRLFRADWHLKGSNILVEFEGGMTTANSGHTGIVDYSDDCEKYAIANILGFVVIRVTAKMVGNGKAFELIERAIGAIK